MTSTNQEKPIEPSEIPSVGFSNSSKPLFPDNFFSQAEGEKFVVFFLNEKLYAVATKEVAEVTQTLPIAFLPNAPEWIFGIANLRGEIITVLNLPHILREETGEISKKSKFVILQSKKSASPIAFTVERVGEIITLPTEKIESVEENSQSHIFGKAAHKLGVLNFINTEKILDTLVF
jgi:purine-binding chemotaxis protein CheW